MTGSAIFFARPRDERTIISHGLPERRADTEHNSREYVLERGYQEESRVFRVLYIGLLGVQLWGDKPWYSSVKVAHLQDA